MNIVRKVSSVLLADGSSISHESESIGTPILKNKVFGAETLEHLLVVDYTARIHGRHPAIYLTILIPRTAAAAPCGAFHNLLSVDIIVMSGIRADLHRPMLLIS